MSNPDEIVPAPESGDEIDPSSGETKPFSLAWRSMTGMFSGEINTLVECKAFIERFEDCVSLNKWDQDQIVRAFKFCLKDNALMWMSNFQVQHPNQSRDWTAVKPAFLLEFDKTSKPQEKVASLADLVMRKSETVGAFAIRVEFTLNMVMDSTMPVGLQKSHSVGFRMGMEAMKQQNLIQYFTNGLRGSLKTKTMAVPACTTFEQLVTAAKQIERSEETQTLGFAELQLQENGVVDENGETITNGTATNEADPVKALTAQIDALSTRMIQFQQRNRR